MTSFSCRSSWHALVAAALFFLSAGAAWSQGQVKSELIVEKLVQQAGGGWAASAAKEVKPGDLVVYTASYRNTGKDPVRALVATVPVPSSMEWQGVAADGKNPPSLASTDGTTFAPIPLTRKVRGADGKEQVQQVPLHEYRALRWTLPDLAAGAVATVKVTTKVSTNP